MRKISFILILTFILFACATSADYDRKLQNLVGVDKTRLEAVMGRPSAVKILPDGKEVLTYTRVDDVYVPSEYYLYNQGSITEEFDPAYAPFLWQYDFAPYAATLGYEAKYTCQTSFLLSNGIVTGWSRSGNNCVGN